VTTSISQSSIETTLSEIVTASEFELSSLQSTLSTLSTLSTSSSSSTSITSETPSITSIETSSTTTESTVSTSFIQTSTQIYEETTVFDIYFNTSSSDGRRRRAISIGSSPSSTLENEV